MAKRKKQNVDLEEETMLEEEQPQEITEPIIRVQEEPKEIDNDDIPDELQSIINECGSDSSYTVGVFRYNDKTQQKEKVGTYQIQDFLPDQIAKNYGGGKYEYMIRVGNKLRRRLTTTYATAIVPEKPQTPTLQEIQEMINSKSNNGNDNISMLELMKLQQAQTTAILTALLQQNQNQNQKSTDDSFDKMIKMMTVLGVKNANNDIDKFLSVFQKGLDLSTKVSDLQNDEDDEESGLISKLLKGVINSSTGAEILQKLLAGKVGQAGELPQVENPLPETIIQPQPQSLPETVQPLTSMVLVKEFLNKHKKRILIELNSNTTIEDLAEFYFNGILIDEDLINAFTEIFLGDYKSIVTSIPEFNEPKISAYVIGVLEKMKDMLYNNDTDNNKEVDNSVSIEESSDTK